MRSTQDRGASSGPVRRVLGSLRQRLSNGYSKPSDYWERRAPGLIAAYRSPETWAARGWNIAHSPEQEVVPEVLRSVGAQSVLVVGAGSGRQYEYLEQQQWLEEIRGFDLSPTMVRECQARFPSIPTVVDDVVDARARQKPADVVLAVTVLQHVRPAEISAAVAAISDLANLAVILLEFTKRTRKSGYMFAHPYRELMGGWTLSYERIVDEDPTCRTELLAWTRPGTPPQRLPESGS